MKIPEQFEIEIPEDKLVNYLLSPTHRIGNHKAEYFQRFGFGQANWKEMERAIREMVTVNEAQFQKENQFGKVYRVEGDIITHLTERIRLRTVWIVEKDSSIARFVTAYPI